jgi:hypothetical protein
VKAAEGDAEKLLDLIINNFSAFNDVHIYKGKHIAFYKRAQLLVSDIYQLFKGKSYGMLKNVDKLTACADYKLPKMLRKLEILEYDAGLTEKMISKTHIPAGSVEEIEIRAATVWATELIKEALKRPHPRISSIHINDALWLLSQDKSPSDEPYHRTRTTSY